MLVFFFQFNMNDMYFSFSSWKKQRVLVLVEYE